MTVLRQWISKRFHQRLEKRINFGTNEDLKRSSMIFAPHQNDETLGCGGTIIRKRAMDVAVDVVFMTDGRSSHSHLISTQLLTALRIEEARSACEQLGVTQDRVSFLNCPDGFVDKVGHMYVPQILELIREREPEEIYIPYANDPQADHVATNRLLCTLLKASRLNVNVMEYPVWAWYQWPWVRVPTVRAKRSAPEALSHTARFDGGLRISNDLNYGISTEDVSEQKLSALCQYHTQMTRFNSDPRWLTLHDVADGDWLEHLLKNSEMFYSYTMG
ncbi:MAG: PIG-L family deacetylase [Chloroflexota bacterium]